MDCRAAEKMRVFAHQLYECRKGVRGLAMCSLPSSCLERAVVKILNNDFDYFTVPVNPERVNIYFGEPLCVHTAGIICSKPLYLLTPEEDFILGTLLGYSVTEQCSRYISRINVRETCEADILE